MKRPIIDKIHDRLWTIITSHLGVQAPLPNDSGTDDANSSVSGTMDWPRACAALADGIWTSSNFRRAEAVRQVVETLGPVDGRYFGKLIRELAPEYLNDQRVAKIDAWGDPIRWPGILLGTPHAFSPTTLRYLAHALWLKKEGFVKEGGTVVEIGVGFGGLAAMNAIVSKATTLMVDLPLVTDAAMRQMWELGLSDFATIDIDRASTGDVCFISNYAFTELSREMQDVYVDKFIRYAKRGVILSNTEVFSKHMQSRDNNQIIELLTQHGAHANAEKNSTILCPSDQLHGNSLIQWMRV